MKIHTLLFLVSLLVLLACSKSEDVTENVAPEPAPNPFENLVDKYYILVSSTSNPAYPDTFVGSSTNIYSDYYALPCILDDLRMFKSNGDCVYDNGPLRCSPLDSQTVTVKWRFIENNTKIQIYNTSNSITTDLKILINDGTTFKYEKTMKYGNDSFVWTETWKVKK
ncbi:MAG: hypothetical protein REI78_12740 [Pedobacter sp.]|nr:hypothetical protein [Pedobacter sp.]MDQ8053893.1 hypothetical protein [Pedobacter sp.]